MGNPGEFTVWVDSRQVTAKEHDRFPTDQEVVDAVKAALPAAK